MVTNVSLKPISVQATSFIGPGVIPVSLFSKDNNGHLSRSWRRASVDQKYQEELMKQDERVYERVLQAVIRGGEPNDRYL